MKKSKLNKKNGLIYLFCFFNSIIGIKYYISYSNVQYSNSQVLKVIFHLLLLQNTGYISWFYLVLNSLYLLIPYPYLDPFPFRLPTVNH